ncbi:hypothetical protein JZ751_012788 [Albula glossodonta]|uniref:PPM-type phosphatase domain-containing protein n=1 Tax=Albula glossodonta TaxID=121402 RepID=A0A8T2MKR7_9TELE|nr:hypothetical protein JZ751_012788 [Albula glossodonta]
MDNFVLAEFARFVDERSVFQSWIGKYINYICLSEHIIVPKMCVFWGGCPMVTAQRGLNPVVFFQDEKRRIEDLGGCIAFMGCWRVNGTYAVSRAIGDFDQKPYISSEADCSSVHLTGEEDYVLLACDGFFDTVRVADVPGLVQEALREGEGAIGDVAAATAQRLVAQAKSAGSSDNITVLLVFLRDPEQLRQEAKRQGAAPPVCGSHQEAPQAQQGPFDQ